VARDFTDDEVGLRARRDGPPTGESDPAPDPAFDDDRAARSEPKEPETWPKGSSNSLCVSIPDPDRSPVDPASAESSGVLPKKSPRTRVDHSSEAEALALVRSGQLNEAFELLMAVYGDPLTTFAVRILRNSEQAEDVRQQVFLEAMQGIGGFRGRSSLWGWLCGIAYHRCLDLLKRLRQTAPTIDDLETLVGEPDAVMEQDRVAKQRALDRCLGKLAHRLRAQLLLRYFFGLTYQEIGEMVNEPHGTVQVRISRILPQLRRCLRDEMKG